MLTFNRISFFAAVMTVGVAWANTASAADCTTTGYSTAYSDRCSGAAISSGAATTSNDTLRVLTNQTAGLIGNRVSQFTAPTSALKMASGPSRTVGGIDIGKELAAAESAGYAGEDSQMRGIAAGAADPKIGVWIDGGYSNIQVNDVITTGNYAGAGFNGDMWSAMVGADYQITDQFLAGVGLGYERIDLDTSFNKGTVKADGYTVAPYGVYRFNDTYSVDLTAGSTWLNYDTTRTDLYNGASMTGSTDATRLFGSANVNANYAFDNWRVDGRLGYLYVNEDQDAYTETGTAALSQGSRSTTLGEGVGGFNVGYAFGDTVPYLKGLYRHDFTNDGGTDDSDFVVGAGVTSDFGGVSLGLEATSVEGRDNTDAYSVNANMRLKF